MLALFLALSLSVNRPHVYPVPKMVLHRNGKDDMACDICKNIVSAVEEAMKSTTVEEEVAALVSQACQLLPSPYSSLCSSVVQQYVPLIMQWLEQGLEALDICVKIGLCDAAPGKKVRIPKGIPNDWACDMCQTVVKTVEESMQSTKVVEEVSVIVEQLCDLMPTPYSTLCHTLVKTYIGLIMELLEQGLEALDVCVRIGLCEPATAIKKIRIPAGAKNDMACDVCKQIVGVVEEAMKSTTVEEEVAALVSQVCQLLPSPYSSLCTTIVQQYVPLIMQLIEQGLEALDICVRIGLCESKQFRPFIPRAAVPKGPACDMCKSVVTAVEEAMKSTTVEEEIAALVAKVCEALPSPVSVVCKQVVETYIPIIMQWLEQGLESLDICVKLGLCDAQIKVEKIRVPRNLNNDFACDMCKTVVNAVEDAMKSTTVEEEIAALVAKVCELMPAPYSSLCTSVVQQYVPIIIQLLEQGLEALDVCVRIGLCDATQTKKIRIPKSIPNDWACDMCQTVVKTVEESMESTKVVEEVSAIVEQLCDLMPTPYSTLCHTLVKTYIGLIIELLEQGLQALDVCVRIGLCEPATAIKKIRIPAGVRNDMACDICKNIVSAVEEAMKSTTVEEEVAALVSQVCQLLPSPYSSLCSTVVQQYVPLIMQLIEQGLEALDICVRIGLCEQTAGPKKLDTVTKILMTRIPMKLPNGMKKNDLTCEMCQGVVSCVQEALASTTSEEEIIEQVSKWCHVFPAPFSTLCDSLVKEYVPVIVQLVKQGLNPVQICSKIGLCEASAKVKTAPRLASRPLLPVPLPAGLKNPDNTTCDVCLGVVGAVEEALKDTTSEEEIKAIILMLCELFPTPYSTLCQTITNQYISVIIELVEQGKSGLDVCVSIGLCPKDRLIARRIRLAAKNVGVRIGRGLKN